MNRIAPDLLLRRLLPLVVSAAAAAGCGSNAPPPRRATTAVAVPKPMEEEAAPKSPGSIYVYTPIGKRDPFQNVFAVKEVTAVVRPGNAKPTPLQRWPLDRLKLAMTMTGTSSPMAMVEDPDGRGWTVRIGTFIGQNWGKVTSIQRDLIVVTETTTDNATGRVYPQNYSIKVPRDALELQSDLMLRDGETLGASPAQGK